MDIIIHMCHGYTIGINHNANYDDGILNIITTADYNHNPHHQNSKPEDWITIISGIQWVYIYYVDIVWYSGICNQ